MSAPRPTRRTVANVLRPRKVVAFSLNGAARALLNVVSERTGESRSRVVERLILEGAWLLYGAGSVGAGSRPLSSSLPPSASAVATSGSTVIPARAVCACCVRQKPRVATLRGP